jgi:hypothetical protein
MSQFIIGMVKLLLSYDVLVSVMIVFILTAIVMLIRYRDADD